MKKLFLVFLFHLVFNPCFGQEAGNFDFNKIYSYVLQGDVAKVLTVLDTVSEERLTSREKEIKEKFFQRFRSKNDINDFNTNDPMLRELLTIYRNYWKTTLLKKESNEVSEKELKKRITSFLIQRKYPQQHDYVQDSLSTEELENNFGQHLKNFLSSQDYFSATGKTAGLYDLFVWSKEVPVEYNVVLPETEIETTIIFLEEVVTMGWEEYASFGRVYPGGWATREVLYAVGKAYDTSTENFKVSYLKHESQHFADYLKFPNLSGADLEYRAKLTELIYAEETLYFLLESFIRNASSEGRNPHAFGGYAVIRDLSKQLFSQEFISDLDQWKSLPVVLIKTESRRLLNSHTRALEAAGADTVEQYIK